MTEPSKELVEKVARKMASLYYDLPTISPASGAWWVDWWEDAVFNVLDVAEPLLREHISSEILKLGVHSDGGNIDETYQHGYGHGRDEAAEIARGESL